jgi:hypothetical protein
VQKELDRRSDETRGELVLLDLEGYDWNRKSWFQNSLAQVRRETQITGEEFLILWEDTFRVDSQFAHEAICNFRMQGHSESESIENALNTLRKERLENSPQYKEEQRKQRLHDISHRIDVSISPEQLEQLNANLDKLSEAIGVERAEAIGKLHDLCKAFQKNGGFTDKDMNDFRKKWLADQRSNAIKNYTEEFDFDKVLKRLQS